MDDLTIIWKYTLNNFINPFIDRFKYVLISAVPAITLGIIMFGTMDVLKTLMATALVASCIAVYTFLLKAIFADDF